jgi:Uma2 family endonuclease
MTRPDWACEILSDRKRDLVIKPSTLHVAQVPHYWVLDANEKLLFVHRWSRDGYVVVLRAAAGDTVRAEPFDAIEIRVGELFGDDE